jgi:iron(III) transport system permease protein
VTGCDDPCAARTLAVTTANISGEPRSPWGRLAPYCVFLAITAFFGMFLIWPVLRVVVVGLALPGSGARLEFTPSYLAAVFSSYEFRVSLFNSAAIACGVTLLCTAISVPLALLTRRFDFRGKGVVTSLLLVPLVLPPFVGAIGLRQIFGASGALTALCRALGLIPPAGAVSWLTGHEFLAVVIAEALSLYPILFLNVAAALSNLDPAMEQAAANLGASSWRIFRSITLASMRPGLFAGGAIVFIWSFGELGTPLMFDFYAVAPVQIFVHITEISDNPIPYALVIVMLLVSAAVYVAGKIAVGRTDLAQTRVAFATAAARVTGLRAVWVLLPFLVVIALTLLPHIGVVLTSFSGTGDWYNSVLPRVFTGEQYVHALSHQIVLSSIRNSVIFSLFSVVLDIVIGTVIAILIVRTRLPGILRGVIDTLSMLPLAVPGMVLAFGYLAISLQLKVWFLGHDWLLQYTDVQRNPTLLLILAYTMRRLPYVVRSTVAGLEQTPPDLELAARNIGASGATTLRRITVPLISANLIAGALLVFAFTMLEVSDSLILVQKQAYWPVTRGIYELFQRLGDGPYIASALGAWTMLLMMLVILFVNSLLGKRLGALFRI